VTLTAQAHTHFLVCFFSNLFCCFWQGNFNWLTKFVCPVLRFACPFDFGCLPLKMKQRIETWLKGEKIYGNSAPPLRSRSRSMRSNCKTARVCTGNAKPEQRNAECCSKQTSRPVSNCSRPQVRLLSNKELIESSGTGCKNAGQKPDTRWVNVGWTRGKILE